MVIVVGFRFYTSFFKLIYISFQERQPAGLERLHGSLFQRYESMPQVATGAVSTCFVRF
jgi:hypothetical protein